jgi:MarR family transcriptional regulator, organic hydroperoxide resistance regulator
MVSARDFWAGWAAVSRLSKSEAQRRLSRLGLHAGQQFVLECLWHDDGLTPSEIARRIGVEAATLTRALRRMEAGGLVERRVDDSDRRRVRTWLTSRGRELRPAVQEAMDRLAEDAVALLSEQETAVLEELLARVGRALGERRAAAGAPAAAQGTRFDEC